MDLFLKNGKPPKLNQDEIDNLNSLIIIKEFEFVIKKFLKKKFSCSFQCHCI